MCVQGAGGLTGLAGADAQGTDSPPFHASDCCSLGAMVSPRTGCVVAEILARRRPGDRTSTLACRPVVPMCRWCVGTPARWLVQPGSNSRPVLYLRVHGSGSEIPRAGTQRPARRGAPCVRRRGRGERCCPHGRWACEPLNVPARVDSACSGYRWTHLLHGRSVATGRRSGLLAPRSARQGSP